MISPEMGGDHSTRIGRGPLALAALAAFVALASASPAGLSQRAPVVAAASDLSFALADIAAQYQKDGGGRVDLVFGSSGLLTRQIRDGAPFQVFLSADESFVRQLAAADLTRDEGVLYAVGRIVLFAPRGSALDPRSGLGGLARLLGEGRVARFAIANPAHAPYGRAAEQVLRRHGLWEQLQPRLVLGENVSQAAQFAVSGSAAGGIIAYSLALAPTVRHRGSHALLDDTDHAPLRQRMVLLKDAGAAAERFYRYLQDPAARGILQRYGFALPR